MKSVIHAAAGKDAYPCLMTSGASVVLFSKINTGTIIVDSGDCKAGWHSSSWDMSLFKPFDGSVTLSNE